MKHSEHVRIMFCDAGEELSDEDDDDDDDVETIQEEVMVSHYLSMNNYTGISTDRHWCQFFNMTS